MSGQSLDFLATILARERLPGGAFAILDDEGLATLNRLLSDYHSRGVTAALEREARTFLISYRALDLQRRGLSDADRARLNDILDAEDDAPQRPLRTKTSRRSPGRWVIAAAIAGVAAVAVAVVFATLVPAQSGPPAAANQGAPALAEQVPPGPTELQELRHDYGPWQQFAPSDQQPQTGSPAVLLLQSGSYLASRMWTVSPGAPGWQPDLGGNVGSVSVHGGYAGITDADGNPYLVGINQPFIVSGNPNTILLIKQDGTVVSMNLAQATAVRSPLRG